MENAEAYRDHPYTVDNRKYPKHHLNYQHTYQQV